MTKTQVTTVQMDDPADRAGRLIIGGSASDAFNNVLANAALQHPVA